MNINKLKYYALLFILLVFVSEIKAQTEFQAFVDIGIDYSFIDL